MLALPFLGYGVFRLFLRQPPLVEIAAATAFASIAAAGIGYVFVRTVSRPLQELAQRATLIAQGRRSAIGPLRRHGSQELALLAEAFMNTAQSLVDRSDYVRNLARHVSHELKSPLTSIRGAAELLRDAPDMPIEQRSRFLDNIVRNVARLTALLERLNEQARAENPVLDGRSDVQRAIAILRRRFADLEIALERQTEAIVAVSLEDLTGLLAHLAENALQHGAKRLSIEARRDGEALRLDLRDDGPGISPNNRDRVFEPFFTTRREAGGAGMGLSIVRAMLQTLGGTIRLEPSQAGAHFSLTIPLAR